MFNKCVCVCVCVCVNYTLNWQTKAMHREVKANEGGGEGGHSIGFTHQVLSMG